MNYTIDFSLVSIAFLSITAFFYSRQPKVPSARNTLFAALLYLGVFFAVMDVLVVLLELIAQSLPIWLLYAANAVFLLSIQLSSALFFLYALVLTGFIKVDAKRTVLISSLPLLVTAALIVVPQGAGGIFYIDADHIYRRGALYFALYANTSLYLAASLTAMLLRRRWLNPKKLLCICAFLAALFVAMLIQYTKPELLLNALANAFALTLIYHVLEAPSTHIDALTGVLNRAALPMVVRESYEQDRRCTLLLFPFNALRLANHSLGIASGDRLLTAIAGCLRGLFANGYIFRAAGDVFAVLLTGGSYCGAEQLEKIAASLPSGLVVGQMEIQTGFSVACVNSEDADGVASMLAMAEYIIQLNRERRLEPLLVADADFKERLRGARELERKLEEAISAGRIEVFYQPLHECDGKLAALEALVRIGDGEGGYLPTQESVELSERNGSIHRLSEQILRRVCEFIRDNDAQSWGLHHIGVNLSALQFMRDDLLESVSGIVDECGVPHSLVAFEITETAAASVADLSRNMHRLQDAGFSMLLDDFGKGYANFNNIAQLPLLCVKIDKSILWEAPQGPERMAFLRGIADMLHTMGLASVCEGVETEEQARLLDELGVNMLQGYLFSKPLPPDALLKYVEEVRGNGL